MNTLHEKFTLKNFNTFNIDAKARFFFEFSEYQEVIDFLKLKNTKNALPLFILGGGSNILLTNDFEGIVLKPNLLKKKIILENQDFVWLEAGAGENWDEFVAYCVSNNYGGIENLSLIPGTVGASPVQNIGAYGVEAKNVIDKVIALNLKTFEIQEFTNADCQFAYRSSLFKAAENKHLLITSVVFKLTKTHRLITHYGNIEEELKQFDEKNIQSVRQAVIQIRERKLPDPKVVGNAGSFFKNPIVSASKVDELRQKFPNIVTYKVSDNEAKLAAGWLIENCGWKGKRIGDAGVHPLQSLVLVNYGNATGREIINLAKQIQDSVFTQFGVLIEMEVNILT